MPIPYSQKAVRFLTQIKWDCYRYRIEKNPQVREWLDKVENPIGQNFIDIRYCAIEADNINYESWFKTYTKLIGWLQKQATIL